MNMLHMLLPEIILAVGALALLLMGCFVSARRAAPVLALLALLGAGGVLFNSETYGLRTDEFMVLASSNFSHFVGLLVVGLGLLVLLTAWPDRASGNASLDYGNDGGEFYGLMLLALTGAMLTAKANDLVLLFLAIELASIPTYVMVAMSRPLPVAQEAGIKYFFLGAMSAALLVFGFSYMYGTTGELQLHRIAAAMADGLSTWQTLAVVLVIIALAFKIAAVPLHFYAGDVYQGAATPVTTLLAFLPKTVGMVAIVKLLHVAGGGDFGISPAIGTLLAVLATLTMTVGNLLGLLQYNVKRVLAYSSIAHSGYMLVPIAAACAAGSTGAIAAESVQAVLFYLVAYGVMSVASFGALMMLPSRSGQPATTAETYDDLAGIGREQPAAAILMAVACFGLIGLPLTIGFFGKLGLLAPAWSAGMGWLVIVAVINAAISAAYYLQIVAAMFLREKVKAVAGELGVCGEGTPCAKTLPLVLAVGLATVLTLGIGIVLPVTSVLRAAASDAGVMVLPSTVETAATPSPGAP